MVGDMALKRSLVSSVLLLLWAIPLYATWIETNVERPWPLHKALIDSFLGDTQSFQHFYAVLKLYENDL